jgi:hypothetical protein
MRYLALATDYDGTLARDGRVDATTLGALNRFRASGRALILVTGREIDDLRAIFPRLDLFDRVVAENGAVLYRPGDHSERLLAGRPPDSFVEALKRRRVEPLSVGRVVVATRAPQREAVVEAIRESGLDLEVIGNKGALMVLPAGVNKATGLSAALDEMGISPRGVVAAGDAENDVAFFEAVGCAAAVANALPAVKARADIVTTGSHGAGVTELIDGLLLDDP